MNKSLKIFISLLLLLLLFNFNLINCQYNIIDLSTSDSHYQYLQINPAGSNECTFQLDFLVTDELGQGINDLRSDNTVLNSFSVTNLISNQTSKLYRSIAKTISVGEFTFSLFVESNSNVTNLISRATVYCEQVDLLNLTVFGEKYEWTSLTDYVAVIKIDGLKYPIYNLELDSQELNIQFIDKNIYHVYLSDYSLMSPSISSITDNWDISIKFTFGTLFAKIPSYYNYNNDKISNFYESIDSTAVYTLIGSGMDPIYKFESNITDVYRQAYFLGALNWSPNLIGGNKTSLTYMGYFSSMYGASGADFTFFFQQGNKLIEQGALAYSMIDPYKNLISSAQLTVEIVNISNSFNDIKMVEATLDGLQPECSIGYFSVIFDDNINYSQFPFGFLNIDSVNKYVATFLFYSEKVIQFDVFFNMGYFLNTKAIVINEYFDLPSNSVPPTLLSIDFNYLYDSFYLVSIQILSKNGLKKIKLYDTLYRQETLVNGTLQDGKYEFIYDSFKYFELTLVDFVENQVTYNEFDYYSINPVKQIQLPNLISNIEFDIYSINSIQFYKNSTIDITNKSVYNRMYFNFTNVIYTERVIGFQLLDPLSFEPTDYNNKFNYYYAHWQPTLQLFVVDFKIPANTQSGIVPWLLNFNSNAQLLSTALPSDCQIRVETDNIDLQGPIFTNITKIPGNGSLGSGWEFTITDSINGLNENIGFIQVQSNLDNSIFNFTIVNSNFSTTGPVKQFDYNLIIPGSKENCKIQDFIITNVILFDSMGINSTFAVTSLYPNPIKNPFINYFKDDQINKYSSNSCAFNQISTLPELNYLIAYDQQDKNIKIGSKMDVGIISGRKVTFELSVTEIESGINILSPPTIYITAIDLNIIPCKSSLVESNITSATFKCSLEIPFRYSYPLGFLVSVYGIISNGGTYQGYSSKILRDMGLLHHIDTSESSILLPKETALITNTSSISCYGGDLWVYGNGFLNQNNGLSVKVTYSQYGEIIYYPTRLYDGVLLLQNIYSTNDSITIEILNSIYTVTPICNFELPSLVPLTTPPPSTVLPTNPPQLCLNNCGGSKHGYCKKDVGCICYSPWVGLSCSSQVIIVPQPNTNETNPTTEIPITGGSESDNILFKSFISLVSLREFDFVGNKVVKTFSFDKWIYTKLNETKNQYQTNITTSPLSGNGESVTTDIIVVLEWFSTEQTIKFANENLTMNPSTIKYTIDITKYAFSSNLNQLQLVMSALLSSNSNDVCSVREFGDTSGDNSNYLKIQVDDHSLYGRFIKRAIIDNKILSISNVLLDKSLNVISSPSQLQSFIGINVPFFKSSITIDPDFSILLDSNSVSSDDDNSICYVKSKALSSGQLAGIIIGSISFAAVVAISITYSILKKRKDRKLALGLQNKLKEINK